MSKRFFISHSSVDKPLALQLKTKLEDDAWVDLHEIDVGDLLLTQITAGIEDATDFVLLWSSASASSSWVQFEFHMAFARWIQKQAIALRIVRLDDTPVPLYFEPFLQGRGSTDASNIADLLGGDAPRAVAHRTFFNRNAEVGAIEDALYSPSVSSIWICGMGGMGKRALAREAVNRVTSGTGASRHVLVTPGVAEPELHLLIASAVGVQPLDDSAELATINNATSDMISQFMGTGGIWIFEEAEHWLEDDASFGRVAVQALQGIMHNSTDWTGRLAIFTSRRRPRVEGIWSEAISTIYLNGLAPRHAVPLIRDRGGSGSEEDLLLLSKELDGHPLALEIIAPQLPVAQDAVIAHRYSVATDLIDPTRYSGHAWRALELLALVDGPLSLEDLAENLSWTSVQVQEAVAEASSFGLTDYSDLGYIFFTRY